MSAFTRHLTLKFRMIVLDPLYSALFIPFCLAMFVAYWVELSQDIARCHWDAPIRWLLMAALTGVLLGGRTSTGKLVQLNKFAMPSLPAKPAVRVAAEVTFLLILMVIARFIHIGFSDSISLMPIISETLIGLLVLIPIFVIFVPRERNGRPYYILDGLVVILTFCILTELGMIRTPLHALITSAILVGAAVGLNSLEAQLYSRFRPANRFRGSMTRKPRNPALQFQRDLWLRPWRALKVQLLALAAFELLGLILAQTFHFPEIVLTIWTGITFFAGFGLLLAPAGTGVLVSETGMQNTFYSDFDGSFLAAWSVLPVHPLRITRGAYTYVLTLGFIFWIATLLTFMLTGWAHSFNFWVPFLIAIPCLAGFITMSAVGHKARSIFLAVLFCAELIIGMGVSDQPGEPGIIGITVLTAFLIASIVPIIPVLQGKVTA